MDWDINNDMTFDTKKIAHIHLPDGTKVRLDTMKDDSGKKYTQKEIDKILEEARVKREKARV